MVTVRDQQLAGRELGRDRLVDGRIVDAPDAVGGAVAVGDIAPGLVTQGGLEVAPRVARVEGEDGGEVVAGGAGQPQAVLLRSRLGPLMRTNALAVGGELDPGEEAAAGEAGAVGRRVVLLERPDRRLGVPRQHSLVGPLAQQLRRVPIGIAAVRIAGQVELDHVVRRAAGKFGPLRLVDHVVGRSDDVGQRPDRAEVVVNGL